MSRFFHYDSESGQVVEGHAPVKTASEIGPTVSKFKPLECCASGVHASQAQELRDYFHQHGETVEVTPAGDPVYTSTEQRRRCLQLRGFHDRNCFC